MAIKSLVLSLPGDFSAPFYEKLMNKINNSKKNNIQFTEIKILDETISDLIVKSNKSIDIIAPFQTNIDEKILSQLSNSKPLNSPPGKVRPLPISVVPSAPTPI